MHRGTSCCGLRALFSAGRCIDGVGSDGLAAVCCSEPCLDSVSHFCRARPRLLRLPTSIPQGGHTVPSCPTGSMIRPFDTPRNVATEVTVCGNGLAQIHEPARLFMYLGDFDFNELHLRCAIRPPAHNLRLDLSGCTPQRRALSHGLRDRYLQAFSWLRNIIRVVSVQHSPQGL
ncbi:unnamed protein product [Laminaria digitata]